MTIRTIKGDITILDVEAIVNAANTSLMGGGGVDGAIHRAGGSEILKECRIIRDRQGGCPTGEAVITTGGRLKARYVIHTVGPVWNGGKSNEDKLLASAYHNSMKIVVEKSIRTVAFPNISTGIYGFPKQRAAEIANSTIRQFESENYPEEVILCCFDDENYKLYQAIIRN